MDNHSVSEANKLLRVLNGEKLKFTVRVHKPDGSVTEFQIGKCPTVKYNEHDRALWLFGYAGSDSYEGYPVMRWQDGSTMLVEENPENP